MAQFKLTNDCFNRICRTCLSTVNKLKSFKQNEDLVTMLMNWTPIKPDKNDLLPKQICVVCISKLNMVHNFIETSVKAQTDLKEAIEEDNQTFLNHLKLIQDEAEAEANDSNEDSDNESNLEENGISDDSDSFLFIAEDDLFEIEEHKLKLEDEEMKNEDVPQPIQNDQTTIEIINVESIVDDSMDCDTANLNSSFLGFNNEEITSTRNNLEKYTETLETNSKKQNQNKITFDSIKYKCYLCDNKLNLQQNDKINIKNLEFSNLNDDAHVLCKKRIRVLRKIIKELYTKQDELSTLNNKWQRIFLQRAAENIEPQNVSNPIPNQNPIEKPLKPHEIGYRKDGQVHLGHLTWIPESAFDEACQFSNPNKFLSSMAIAIFGEETLAKSTITGISKNGVKKEALNSIRMCALKSAMKYYMKENDVPEYYQQHLWKNFNKILGQKISTISTEYNKRKKQTQGVPNKKAKK